MGDERRRHKRITVKGISGNMFTTSKVEIVNISLGGIAIQLNRNLQIGKSYAVKLTESKGKSIELKGTVMWSVLEGSQKGPHGDVVPVYQAGIKFDDVLTDKTTELIDFIEKNKTSEGRERLRGLRFKIHAPQNSVIFYPSSYKVKLISPFGMLIETVQSFKPEEKHPMEILLPDGKGIRVIGRIVSCTEIASSSPASFDLGVEFLEVYAEDRANLESFIRSITTDDKK